MKMPNPTKAQHSFATVPSAQIERSSFNRSRSWLGTFDAGYLIPFMVDEVLPGDTVNMRTHGFARLATPLKPIMDSLFIDTFYFFVPCRLLWTNWVKFNGEQNTPGDSTSFVVPQFQSHIPALGSVSDHRARHQHSPHTDLPDSHP